MAVRRNNPNESTTLSSTATSTEPVKEDPTTATKNEISSINNDNLPPLFLIYVVLLCSGFVLMFNLRDFMMTGRNIFGTIDEAHLLFTKSTDWFSDEKGWKSTMGGFSAIQQTSTDENNMGGLFVRKMAGAAAAGVQLQKILPVLFQPIGANWKRGDYRPLFVSCVVANLCVIGFFAFAWDDLRLGGATALPQLWIGALLIESAVLIYCVLVLMCKSAYKGPAIAMPPGKTPSSLPSRIVSRTILIVSSAIALIAGRDFLVPGQILDFIPRDDIYLEWTNAFHHSPPEGSPEYAQYGLQSALFVGDKFVSQYMALNLLLLCFFKVVSAVGIRYGADGRGETQAKMIWAVQALSNGMVLLLFRLFSSAARSASLDFRWHLIAIAYETFILGLFGFL